MSEKKVFDRFRDYFQAVADSFEDEKLATKIFPNPVDSGTAREDIFMRFLKRHLPLRCEIIKGGFIFDSDGNESKQIDLIITNDFTIRFKQFSDETGGKSFNFVEGCYGAISVKTDLDKTKLYDCLDNLASIPLMPKLKVNPNIDNKELVQDLPFTAIFAFSGMDVKTTLSHVEEYFSKNIVHDTRKPTFIIVNNKYIIFQNRKRNQKPSGEEGTPSYHYEYRSGIKYIGAYSLWWFLFIFQKAVNFGPNILIDYKKYGDEMVESIKRGMKE